MNKSTLLVLVLLGALLGGCATTSEPIDYRAFNASKPKSILVVPPTNNTNEVFAPYGLLANVAKPLSESGYYVFPVALVADTFIENGLSVAEDIHALPTSKLYEVFNADAALYIDIEQYGTSYVVIASDTVVSVTARLVDLRNGNVLWYGKASAASSEQRGNSGGGVIGMLVEAAVAQIIETSSDKSFEISAIAASRLLSAGRYNGLLYGPRSPKYGEPVKTN